MFEPKFVAERKVSFERDGLDASKACHISARGNAQPCRKDWKRRAEAGRLTKCDQLVL